MIYKRNTLNESVELYGADADSFLEEFGIELYEDHLIINEMSIDGIIGEDILAENGIILNEDCVVLEGKQAEEYKARKAKDKIAREEPYNSYSRYFSSTPGAKDSYGNDKDKNFLYSDRDKKRNDRAINIVDHETNRRKQELQHAEDRLCKNL